MACCELIGIGAAQRVPEQMRRHARRDSVQQRADVVDVHAATALVRMPAPSMFALVERHDPPRSAKCLGQRREVASTAKVPVQAKQHSPRAAEVQPR